MATVYLLFSLVYIFFSDKLVDFIFLHSNMLTTAQTYKGFAFVTATSGLIYFLSRGKTAAIKSLEQRSEDREAFYKALIMQSGDMTLLTGNDGKIKFASENISNLLGYSREEFVTVNAFDLVHPHDQESVRRFNREVINNPGISYNYEARVLHKDGRYIWMEGVIVNWLQDPNIQGVLTTARNTEKRKLAEERVQESERMFRAAFEQISVGMANINLAGDWVLTNNHLCTMTGYSVEELEEMKYWDISEPAACEEARKDFERVIAGDETSCCRQRRMARKDGTILHVEQMLSLISDENGHPLYVALVVKDIEAATRTKNELAYKNRELDTFIYRSSHDLRGPITTLIGLTELARTEVADENAREYFTNCRDVAKRMRKTLDDLMAVNYIKHLPATAEVVRPETVLKNALATEMMKDKLKSATFFPEIEQSATCYTNANLFSLIIRHLLSNALTFRQKDTEHKVYMSINTTGESTGIYVMDNGSGIDANDKEQIFDLYYRGKSPERGSGVGLYIVKTAVEKLGGTIAIESEPGYGTRFMVTLPNVVA